MCDLNGNRKDVFKRYFLKLVFRVIVFAVVFFTYISHREWLEDVIYFRILQDFKAIYLLWFVLMIGMIKHLIPDIRVSMSLLKKRKDCYIHPQTGYDRTELLEHVQEMNIGAWKVMLVWLIGNSVFAVLYLFNIIGETDLLMLSVFYYLCDTICIVIFCPFQKFLMKNRCCVDCRIFDWGHFMMYTPMIFIKSFFSWSLFFMACLILIKWELIYARHPERFWDGSNDAIKCKNCKDKLCHIKSHVNKGIDHALACSKKNSTSKSTQEP